MLAADVVPDPDAVTNGELSLRDGPGLGVTPDEAALARLAPTGGRS
jgi:L-alanine-DL-glutamate epimerase-like enolase superfamily enzyme